VGSFAPEYHNTARRIAATCRDCDWRWYGYRGHRSNAALNHARTHGHRVEVRREVVITYLPTGAT
jgi:hypothetical protein